MLMAELNAAIAIFALLVLAIVAPLAMDQSMVRQMTVRAVVMEIVDGEMELLAAGGWRSYQAGEQEYQVTSEAAKSLPKGRFVLLVNSNSVRLDWRVKKQDGRESVRVEREFRRLP
jgi:hypothetical protein